MNADVVVAVAMIVAGFVIPAVVIAIDAKKMPGVGAPGETD
jgi:hypothetical protein